jgi:hypothetical protein
MRRSSNEYAHDGSVRNGYDYQLQVWIVDGKVTDVGNCPEHVGRAVRDVPGHEVKPIDTSECIRIRSTGKTI